MKVKQNQADDLVWELEMMSEERRWRIEETKWRETERADCEEEKEDLQMVEDI